MMTDTTLQYLRRLSHDQEDGDVDHGNGSVIGGVIAVNIFFFIWNCAMANFIVTAISEAFHGNYGGLFVLCCPHWLIGLAIPVGAALTIGGLLYGPVILLFTVVVPYSFAIWYRVAKGQSESQTNNAESEVPNEEEAIQEERRGDEEHPDTFGYLSELFKMPAKESNKEDCLILKKAIQRKEDDRDEKDIEANTNTTDRSVSYRTGHPKTDLFLPCSSQEVCSICLEEYQDGDAIAWSKNKDCHHAHHLCCLSKWLEDHDDCPACRRPFCVEP